MSLTPPKLNPTRHVLSFFQKACERGLTNETHIGIIADKWVTDHQKLQSMLDQCLDTAHQMAKTVG
ncbi:MAG TPA: hypothetical protein DCE42_10180 [Myxococcales bacterium]|nr:hypothetical protein [Deltaproteobacteria bacterium]MBU50678.1 hypothetical protein [Deltaproteobacteria bacterium]HAA55117.1 hypothetical protein [Myxococcales bacterium]